MSESTLFAHVTLLAWIPLVALAFFRLRLPVAVATAMLAGAMFLPEDVGFDYSGLPEFNKHTITVLCVFFGVLVRRRRLIVITPDMRAPALLFAILLAGAVATALTNMDPLPEVDSARLRVYDAASMAADDLLRVGLPFFLGAAVFRSSEDLRDLLTLTALAGLVYSLPALLEVRLSPQLHGWVYGFKQNEFLKARRLGGWRPMVFMQTGLALAIFMLTTVLACATLVRARLNVFFLSSRFALVYLVAVLVACKSLGSIVYAAAFLPLYFVRLRWMTRLTLVLSVAAVGYPLLRAADVVPTEAGIAALQPLAPERAYSLEFRFDNEDLLLARSRERALFGWGTFGRNRVFDPVTGRDVSTTDGHWIIVLGQRGWTGLIAVFGLLILPVWRACRRVRSIPQAHDRALVIGLALLVVVRVIDMLPNGWYSVIPPLFAGALCAAGYTLRQATSADPAESAAADVVAQ